MNKKAIFIIPLLLIATAFSAFSLNILGTNADYRLGLTYDTKTLFVYLAGEQPAPGDSHNITLSNTLMFNHPKVDNKRFRLGPRADFQFSILQGGTVQGHLNAAFSAEYNPLSASIGLSTMLFDSTGYSPYYLGLFLDIAGTFFFDKVNYKGFGLTVGASVLPVKINFPASGGDASVQGFQDLHVNVGIVYVF